MLQIGSLRLENDLILAPMAGISNLPFRLIVKEMGASLVTSEMVSAVGLCLHRKRTISYLKSCPEEKPLAVQIFGAEPDPMAEAAKMVIEAGANIVDINIGCPAKKVTKTGAGGALLKQPKKIAEIVSQVRRVCSVPLTVKIRAGWSPDQPNAVQIATLAADCGADAITLHPRYVSQGFSGNANWSMISELKTRLKIPIIGNGDVFSPHLAWRMKTETGCDGVMVARGALGNPWIFRQILEMKKGIPPYQPQLEDRRKIILKHFSLLYENFGEYKASKLIRGVLIWFTKGLPQSACFRGKMGSIQGFPSLMDALDRYFDEVRGTLK